jgi:hypothetical protein
LKLMRHDLGHAEDCQQHDEGEQEENEAIHLCRGED